MVSLSSRLESNNNSYLRVIVIRISKAVESQSRCGGREASGVEIQDPGFWVSGLGYRVLVLGFEV